MKTVNEMQEEVKKPQGYMYIFALDFLDGKIYRYDISQLCNNKNWSNPEIIGQCNPKNAKRFYSVLDIA